MRRVLLLAPILLVLTGCQTSSVPTSPLINVGVSYLPEHIQQHVRNACGWVEPLSNLAKIVASLGGFSVPDIANQVAQEICTAVRPPVVAGRRMAAKRTVQGVRLQGRFVNG
jgi:hypothetical protein